MVAHCSECTVSFSSVRFTDEYLHEKYYRFNYHEEMLGEGEDYRNVSADFFRSIARKVHTFKTSGKWLDIGCGSGYLLREAARLGYECTGIDVNEDFKAGDGIRFLNADLDSAELERDYFDIVSMVNVIDHIPNAAEILKKVNSLLKSGGLFFIHVQNEFFFDKPLFRKVSTYCPNVHLVNYSHRNIGNVLRRFGFNKTVFLNPSHKKHKGMKGLLTTVLNILNRLMYGISGSGIWIVMEVAAFKNAESPGQCGGR